MTGKHLDDESEGDYDESYPNDEDNYDADGTEQSFEYNDGEYNDGEYNPQFDYIVAKDIHQKIIAAAAECDLTDPESKQLFLQEFRCDFKQIATDDYTLLHSLAREMYDKSYGKGKHDYKKYIPFLDILLDDQPDLPIHQDSQGRTALHIVVEALQSEVATYLCDRIKCELNLLELTKKDGDTVIHIAVRENLDCVEHFVKRAISKGQEWTNEILSIQGEKGNTPLHIAVDYRRCYGNQAKLVKLLLDASDQPLSKENKEKLSPFRYHCETQRTAKAPLHAPRMVRTKPPSSSDRTGGKPLGISRMGLRPRRGLPADKETPSESKSHTALRSRPPIIRSLSEQPQQKADPEVAKAIQDMMLRHCLRTKTRDEAIRILHGPVALRQIDFDLAQTRNSSIEAGDLSKIATHLNFEPALQYVAIPQLEIENFHDTKWNREEFWDSAGRKDYLAIFDWLYERGVRHIIRVIVVDHEDRPHSDAVMIKCLNRFGVERLDWKRFDLSSRVIAEAVPEVMQLKLYCSGNEAILSSWASNSGLVNLKQLTEIEVEMSIGLETRQRTKDALANFKFEMRKTWDEAGKESQGSEAHISRARKLEVKCKLESIQRTQKKIYPGDSEKKHDPLYEQRELWIHCMKAFASFIRNYKLPSDCEPVVKVAIIDDGVESTYQNLNHSIKAGQSYSIRNKEQGLWNPYYRSANGHGTVMACLILQMCPDVQLFVARLDERKINGKVHITASSAAKAINWARKMGVNIISMSWSIDKITNPADARDLIEAVEAAINAGILLFCASDDQGNRRSGDSETYPARVNPRHLFRIGAATRSELQHEWVQGLDFVLPGEKDQLVPFFGEQLSSHAPRSPSSLATALASGLAALILYCAMVDGKRNYELLKTWEKMNGAFKNLCKSHPGNQYLHVTEVFGEYLPKDNVGDAGETETENKRAIEQVVAHLLRN